MAFSINTNITSLQAQQYLRVTSDFQQKTINRVTSGLRIVTSGDDAAGLAIANSYRSDQSVLNQGVRNANDGLSQLQIVDGGMTNISQLLDRARTLATQSATGTFTGDRGVLNSEFSNVITEINRQAQSIGLDSGGALAKSLSVFIGGGKTNSGVDAIANGSVGVDLSLSTIDAKSLGLQGVRAAGVSGTDIGSGSAATSLTNILANSVNTASVSTPNYTTFYLKGPGFDGQGVKLTVNTQNLGSSADLATAVNTAIAQAGNGGTQAATALRNAGISASINTDSTGKQQLTFNSSNAVFQVQAGDRLANALMGNFEQNASVASTATYGTVDMSVNHTLSFKFDGSSSTVSVDMGTSSTTSKATIVSKLNADSSFAEKANAYLSGNTIVVRSKANSSTSQVTVVNNATSTAVGLTAGSDVTGTAATASTGAALTTTVQGSAIADNKQNVLATDTAATQTIGLGASDALNITVNGVTAALTIGAGAGLTKAQVATAINTAITANGTLTGASAVSASVVNDRVVLTAGQGGSAVSVNAGSTLVGFTSAVSSASTPTFATSDSIVVRLQGGGMSSPVDISLSPTVAGSTTVAGALADLQSRISTNAQLIAAGISVTTAESGKGLTFTSKSGSQFEVQATGDTQNKLGLGSFLAGNNGEFDYTARTATTSYSNAAIVSSNTASLEISLNGGASSTNVITASLNGAATDATSATMTGQNAITYVAGALKFDTAATTGVSGHVIGTIDGVHAFDVTVGKGAATTLASVINAFNTTASFSTYATAGLDATGSKMMITSKLTGTGGAASVALGAGGTDDVVAAALGFTAANVSVAGQNASQANIQQQLNAAIAADAELVKAGLQAVADTNDATKIRIVSNNSTNFRVDSFGGNIGFGNLGGSFAGNFSSQAPMVSSTFDSNGANATAVMNFSDMLYAGDKQVVTVTANDASGAKHSIGITLQNVGTSRNAQTLDAALNAINTALQQSNDSTLQKIVAVNEQTSAGPAMRFLSSVSSFQVDAGTTPGGTGLTPPTGNVASSTMLGTGAASSIADQASAQSAVSALSNAVATLGRAQAVVGRGQNQFNYAINLAQSQLSNLAASESRIRDADLASEAANMTKAQILLQAGIAALAQANSAPQQVLTLLRG